MVLIVSSAENVTLKIDPSVVLATRKYADERDALHVAALDPHPQYLTAAEGDVKVAAAVAALVGASPQALDTLAELAAAMNNDANFAATMAAALAAKAPLASPGFIGAPTAPTSDQFDNSARLATTQFVKASGLQFSADRVLSGSALLSQADAGKLIVGGSSAPLNATLPLANSVPSGTVIHFFNSGPGPMTVLRQGADLLDGLAGSTSVVVRQSDSLAMSSLASGTWRAVGGSAQLPYSSSGKTFMHANSADSMSTTSLSTSTSFVAPCNGKVFALTHPICQTTCPVSF